ncbi:hypothetical protein B0T16DRAFT_393279 [Cercophora newfieldiana]|uniref:Uncharacterized protein n=1 Tax=Cercophora newfieldiana TaxID=92897 RepID=A0AA39XVB4_9PEZI|nr:hypothetical protein B0T16DRAFT_393279 [Cercophora newfieldiana]
MPAEWTVLRALCVLAGYVRLLLSRQLPMFTPLPVPSSPSSTMSVSSSSRSSHSSSSSSSSRRSSGSRRPKTRILPHTTAVNTLIWCAGRRPRDVKAIRVYETDWDDAFSDTGSSWSDHTWSSWASWSSFRHGTHREYYFVESPYWGGEENEGAWAGGGKKAKGKKGGKAGKDDGFPPQGMGPGPGMPGMMPPHGGMGHGPGMPPHGHGGMPMPPHGGMPMHGGGGGPPPPPPGAFRPVFSAHPQFSPRPGGQAFRSPPPGPPGMNRGGGPPPPGPPGMNRGGGPPPPPPPGGGGGGFVRDGAGVQVWEN